MSNENEDLIIDLTDLMDEEDSHDKEAGEKTSHEATGKKIEIDTFDLGKELSIDDNPRKTEAKESFDFDKIFRESLNGIAAGNKPEPVQTPAKDVQAFPFEERPSEPPIVQAAEHELEQNTGFEREMPVDAETEKTAMDEARESLARDIPAMVESIARPVITDLINEIVASVKKDLPGIIEKVIREEIEKLKKID